MNIATFEALIYSLSIWETYFKTTDPMIHNYWVFNKLNFDKTEET